MPNRPAIIVLLLLAQAAASETHAEDALPFCAQAQQWIAETSLVAEVVQPENFDAFVESKASPMPLVVQQFANADGSGLSCKMNSAEAIRKAGHGEASAGDNQSCHLVTQRMLDGVASRLKAEGIELTALPTVLEEDMAYMGPMWLDPWPYPALTRGDDGAIQLHAKAMYVPDVWYIPMPARFKGVYYCHLVHPDYLESALRNSASL